MTIQSKFPDVGRSIFSVTSQLTAEHDAINLSQRFSDSDTHVPAIGLHDGIPSSVFYGDGQDKKALRFCYAKQDQTIQKAAEILCKI